MVAAIDQELQYQPEIAATYGQLAQAVILNRMSLRLDAQTPRQSLSDSGQDLDVN